MKTIVASVLCLGLGLGVGYLRASSAAPETRIERTPPIVQTREVVRRENVREERSDSAPHTDVRVDDGPVDDAPVDDTRVERARLVVDRAKTRGAWTDRDRDDLRDAMEGLAGSTKAEIAATFSDAVNRGELRIETEIPL